MEIAIIADDKRKDLMTQFCIAYCGILSKHTLCATDITGKYIEEATGINIDRYLAGSCGGVEQITSRIAFDEIDMVLFFRDGQGDPEKQERAFDLIRACDMHNVPIATNIATAEVLVCALDRGDLNWREFINPRSEYNRKRKESSQV